MDRRTLLGVLTNSFILTALKPFVKLNEFVAESKNRPPLFFSNLKDLSRIRANSKTPLLKSYFKQCLEADLPADRAFLRSAANTRDLIRDLLRLQRILRRESLVYLVNQNRIRKDIILQSMETILQMPRWDYFQNGQNLTIGLQRAPETIIALLFAREVLGGALNESRNKKILTDIAEKGCLPCYRSLQGMQNKEKESGWHFDPQYAANYAVDMQRWPIILNRTNLKAIPTAGLGLGAL
ncbi:MAG: hypothetical protein ACE5HX_10250, partial [bacterium]